MPRAECRFRSAANGGQHGDGEIELNIEIIAAAAIYRSFGLHFKTNSVILTGVEQFKPPPIQEALLDIQVALPGDVTLDTLKKFHAGLETRFPEKKERISSP